MRSQVKSWLSIVLVAIAIAPAVNAQPRPRPVDPPATTVAPLGPSEAERHSAEANRLYWLGKALQQEHKIQEAYAAYKEAFSLKQTYDIAGNLGQIELHLGRMRDAAEHLSFALHHLPLRPDPEVERIAIRLDEQLREAKSHVGTLRIEAPEGTAVMLDGRRIGWAPISGETFADPGKRMIQFETSDGSRLTQMVMVNAASSQTVEMPAVPAKSAPAAVAKTAAVSTPSSPQPAPADLDDAQIHWIRASLIVTGLGVAVGTGFQVAAVSARDAKEANSADTYQTIAIAGFVGAAIGALSTAAGYHLWPAAKPSARSIPRVVVLDFPVTGVGLRSEF